ncbi:hypothetical protein PMIN07_000674 [Paraphaeosphaeria minitans]
MPHMLTCHSRTRTRLVRTPARASKLLLLLFTSLFVGWLCGSLFFFFGFFFREMACASGVITVQILPALPPYPPICFLLASNGYRTTYSAGLVSPFPVLCDGCVSLSLDYQNTV